MEDITSLGQLRQNIFHHDSNYSLLFDEMATAGRIYYNINALFNICLKKYGFKGDILEDHQFSVSFPSLIHIYLLKQLSTLILLMSIITMPKPDHSNFYQYFFVFLRTIILTQNYWIFAGML